MPLISDFDEHTHRFIYDDKFAFKNPDWTYSIPAAVEAPVPPWHHLDFHHEINELKTSDYWKSEDRAAKTLLKERDFRIVLTLMKAGAALKEHQAQGYVALHVLQGSIQINSDGNTGQVEQGQMMILSPGAPHSVQALDEAAFLMFISHF